MSSWTYVYGSVTVDPPGNGQFAKEFVLKEVLSHQPKVWGSEGCMEWHILQPYGHNSSCNHDEFGQRSNLLERGWYDVQTEYVIVLEGKLRDTYYEDTLRSFSRWLDRLSKRVRIEDMLVRVWGMRKFQWGYGRRIFDGAGHYRDNYREFIKEGTRIDKELETRRSTDFRYGIMPDPTFWPNTLVNLVPGGHRLAMEHDALNGNLEIEEYLSYDYDADKYTGVDPYYTDLLERHRERLEDIHDYLRKEELWGNINEEL